MTRSDEWPADGNDLTVRLAGWFGDNAWLVWEVAMYETEAKPAPRAWTSVGEVDPSPSRIRNAIDESEQRCSEVHELLAQLEKRLDTVLVPAPPAVAQDPQVSQTRPGGPPPSHLVARLAILNESLQGAAMRTRGLLQRIDV